MGDPDDRQLARRLGRLDVLSIVTGAIVGVGIFFQPGAVARLTGSAPLSLAAWAIGGVIALTGALTFAELGALFPATGGQYLILRETYGPAVGFLYCWALLSVIMSGAIGIIAVLCVRYLARAGGVELPERTALVLSIILIAALSLWNGSGVQRGAMLSKLAMALKAAALLGIAAVGLFGPGGGAHLPAVPLVPIGDGSLALLAPAIVPVLFSFGGWQQATFLAGEVRDPGRTLPLGIIGGVLAVIAMYLSLNIGYLRLLGVERMAATGTLAADAVAAVLPGSAERLVSVAVAISALGITSVCLMTAPRMYKALADDGAFFAALGRVHPRFGTPLVATWTQGVIAIGLLLVAGFNGVDQLTTGVVCLDWVFFALTGLSLFLLRRRRPEALRPYRAFGYPVLPGIFFLASLGAIVATFADPHTRQASVVAVAVLLSGAVVYTAFRRKRGPVQAPGGE